MDDILFLAHRIPYPPDRGDRIRSWNIIRHLAGLARVHLACFADDDADMANLGRLRKALGNALGEAHVEVRRRNRYLTAAQALLSGKPISLVAFDGSELRPFVCDLLQKMRIETIFAFSGQMAQFVPKDAKQHFIMDFVDMDSAKFAAFADTTPGPRRWVYRREAAKLFLFERQTAERADTSLFVSEAEADLFRRKAQLPQADIRALENGVDLDFYNPGASFSRLEGEGEGPLLVFTGQMDYWPNIEAVTVFARKILPQIRARKPDARFAIVGRRPPESIRRLAALPGVIVTGEVADVRTWLAAADIVVAPLQIARGIQNKVLEAMAMARPVVASPPAFEGIIAEPGRDLIVAKTEDQADAVLDLLADAGTAHAMGIAAREQMETVYPWEAKLAPLTSLLSQSSRKRAA